MTPIHQSIVNGICELYVSPFDRGLAYGDGVFRTIKAAHGKPDTWALHYQKLKQDCEAIGLVCPSAELLMADIALLHITGQKSVIKIIVTSGPGERGYQRGASASTRIVSSAVFPEYPDKNFSHGITLYPCNLRLSHQPLLAGVKHLNRLENVLARAEWSDPDITDGLLLDEDGLVIECVSSNIFARFGRKLVTPALDKCGVAGITRQRILDAAPKLDYATEILPMDMNLLLKSDEIIICNSLYGAWQVLELQGHKKWAAQGLAEQIRKVLET